MKIFKVVVPIELIASLVLLLVISGLSYLPFVGKFGYFYDDWYALYAARAYGPEIFHDLFSIDRPARAFVMIPLYKLFGENPLYYNITAYLFRFLGALALLWIMRMLWPKQRAATTLMALFFLIYPGFLSQPNAIDYQSHFIALFLALFSIALTVKSLTISSWPTHFGMGMFAVLLGWAYLGLMEYFIGFELIRFLLVFVLVSREKPTWIRKIIEALRQWWLYAVIPLVFVVWRIFIFQGERKATDIGSQLTGFLVSPFHIVLEWVVNLFQSSLNVLFLAWGVPVFQLTGILDAPSILLGVGIAALAIILVILYVLRYDQSQEMEQPEACIWLGLVIVLVGLIPIIIANRLATFPDYSRYTLVSSMGASMVSVAGLFSLTKTRIRLFFIAILTLIAVLTHVSNGIRAAQETASLRSFWWQVVWRIPKLEQNTTLIAYYPQGIIQEDYFVWGPANLIYYPEKFEKRYVQPGLFAAILNDETVLNVLMQQRQQYDLLRTIRTYANFRNILVLTKPSQNSCVHVLDGSQPEFSSSEKADIILVAPYSEINHILLDDGFPMPPQSVFGSEPVQNWCYYYEKASLARQKQDWSSVTKLAEEATQQGVAPIEKIEWLPFLQAYTLAGNVGKLIELAPQVTADPYVAFQACRILSNIPDLRADIQDTIRSLYCVQSQ